MKDEALRQALDYIIATNKSSTFWLVPQSELNKTVTAIKQALAQPEQDWIERERAVGYREGHQNALKQMAQPEPEPVAFYVFKPTLPRGHLGNVSDGDLPWVYDQDPSSGYTARMLVYTSPPKREPLTRKEIDTMADDGVFLGNIYEITRAIEAKLKEKNG